MDVVQVIGDNVRRLRRERGLTQEQLRDLSGVRQQFISELESGRSTNPSVRTIARLCEPLGVALADLVTPSSFR